MSQSYEVGNVSYGSTQGSEPERKRIKELLGAGFVAQGQRLMNELPKQNVVGEPLPLWQITVWKAYLPRVYDCDEIVKYDQDTIPQEVLDAFWDAVFASAYEHLQLWCDERRACSMLVGITREGAHYFLGRWGRKNYPFRTLPEVAGEVWVATRVRYVLAASAAEMSVLEIWWERWNSRGRLAQCAVAATWIFGIFLAPFALELGRVETGGWWILGMFLYVSVQWLYGRTFQLVEREARDRCSQLLDACDAASVPVS